jgi:hypothetical protein
MWILYPFKKGSIMADKLFRLVAKVSTHNPEAIGPLLEKLIDGCGTSKLVKADDAKVEGRKSDFIIQAEFEGGEAKDLNRSLLSALRKVEKRTCIRAEWTSGNTTEHFFDYVLKKKTNRN